jgi:hypothetical protein
MMSDLGVNRRSKQKLSKRGVLHKRKTSCLARLNHYCVQNALLESDHKALRTITGGVLTLTGLLS